MARPTKSASAYSGKIGKEKLEARKQTEEKLKGNADKISPPTHLSTKQKKIFKHIVTELEASGILGNLDTYILTTAAIAIDRMQAIEEQINNDINLLMDKSLMSAKEKYTKEFFRCCNELSLSPQSRAKLSNTNVQAKEQQDDPLLKILAGGKK